MEALLEAQVDPVYRLPTMSYSYSSHMLLLYGLLPLRGKPDLSSTYTASRTLFSCLLVPQTCFDDLQVPV